MSLPDFSETVDIEFHSTSYLLTVSTINGDTLSIEAEQKSDASRWRGDFTSRYIEDISAKTGNFKKFTVFVKMLLSALKQASESVFVDLLTYQDLEVLKNRKNGGAGATAGRPNSSANNKRYLILTYAAEFDRVHYPLPLQYEDSPDPEHLKAAISRLRAELEVARLEGAGGRRALMEGSSGSGAGGGVELRRLREENSALRQQMKQLERSTRGGMDAVGASAPEEIKEMAKALKLVRKERDLLQARAEHAEVEMERERGLHRRELRRKAKEGQEVVDELSNAKETIRDLKAQIRQLMGEMEGSNRNRFSASASERTRAAYGQPARERGSRPTSGSRGASPSYGSAASASARRDRTYDNSRTAGREYSAPSSRDRSRPTSRPSSAPSARFDPTAYVREKRDRLAAASRGRSPTPSGRSNASSGRSTPHSYSRQTSAQHERVSAREREQEPVRSRGQSPTAYPRPAWGGGASELPRSNSRGGSQGTSRPASSDRNRAGSSGRDARLPDLTNRSRGSSPGRQVSNAWGDGQGWSKYPLAAAGNRQSQNNLPVSASTERATSPGRALQEVKRKLSEYVNNRSANSDSSVAQAMASVAAEASTSAAYHDAAGGSMQPQRPADSSTSEASKAGAGFDDTSSEIADIDSRLHALQNFLKMAKSSQGSVPA